MTVHLANRDLEREGLVVRSRLKRVPNEDVKCYAFIRPDRWDGFPIGTSSLSNRQMGYCYSRIMGCVRPFGCISVIALLTCLTSRFRSFAAI